MTTKTFNIGESAIGGRIRVYHGRTRIKIDALDWNTRDVVKSATFYARTDTKRQLDNYLSSDITSSFYADKIIKWIYRNE